MCFMILNNLIYTANLERKQSFHTSSSLTDQKRRRQYFLSPQQNTSAPPAHGFVHLRAPAAIPRAPIPQAAGSRTALPEAPAALRLPTRPSRGAPRSFGSSGAHQLSHKPCSSFSAPKENVVPAAAGPITLVLARLPGGRLQLRSRPGGLPTGPQGGRGDWSNCPGRSRRAQGFALPRWKPERTLAPKKSGSR